MVLVLMIGILSESAQGVYAQTTAGRQAVARGQAVAGVADNVSLLADLVLR